MQQLLLDKRNGEESSLALIVFAELSQKTPLCDLARLQKRSSLFPGHVNTASSDVTRGARSDGVRGVGVCSKTLQFVGNNSFPQACTFQLPFKKTTTINRIRTGGDVAKGRSSSLEILKHCPSGS